MNNPVIKGLEAGIKNIRDQKQLAQLERDIWKVIALSSAQVSEKVGHEIVSLIVKYTVMKKSEAVEAIIQLSADCLKAIDEKPLHPEIKAALKENFINECYNKSIRAVEEGRFKNIVN